MLQAGKVALGQLSVGGSEKLVAIKPCGKGLLLETLRYADEVRKGQAFFAEIDDTKPKKKLLDLPKTLMSLNRRVHSSIQAHQQEGQVEANKAIIEDTGDGQSEAGHPPVLPISGQSTEDAG